MLDKQVVAQAYAKKQLDRSPILIQYGLVIGI